MNIKNLLDDKRNSVLLNVFGAIVILVAVFLGGYSLLDAIQTYL